MIMCSSRGDFSLNSKRELPVPEVGLISLCSGTSGDKEAQN